MTRSYHSLALVFSFLVLALLVSGCSFVRIQNVSSLSITVSVRVPDSGKAYIRNIRSGEIVDVFSSHGGSYTITIIPSEAYKNTLESLKSAIEQRLFQERQSLTAEEVAQLVANLNQIDQLLEDLQKPGATCSGYLPDYETVVATVSYDDFGGEYSLICGSGAN